MSAVRVGAWLDCGCCGTGFQTWHNYKHQDQDNGYGICRDCQADAHHDNRSIEQDLFDKLRSALNEANQVKFDACPLWKKRYLVSEAFKSGHLTWRIAQ